MGIGSTSVATAMARLRVLRTYVGLIVLVVIVVRVFGSSSRAGQEVLVDGDLDPQRFSLVLDLIPATAGKHRLPVPYGVVYSGLASENECKRYSQIVYDLHRIEQTLPGAVIRVESCDCGVLQALDTIDSNTKIIAGVEVYGGRAKVEEQLEELHRWDQWQRVAVIVVGSRAVDASNSGPVVEAIVATKQWLKKKGVLAKHAVAVTTAEPLQSYMNNERFQTLKSVQEYKAQPSPLDLCQVVDVIGLVVEPYFNTGISASQSGAALERDVAFASYVCSDEFIGAAHSPQTRSTLESDNNTTQLPIIVLEAGWPSESELGNQDDGRASEQEQRTAINSLVRSYDGQSKRRIPVVLYEYEHGLWRDPGELSVEQYFGISEQYST